ncbi:hypothetical protein TVAG_023500 [Trichomonas vaginalis G3]|uniref:Uncharacterized protein n=1 Tax=Trichomonas vaginalis (strain ATCC PRA-98 / G3) TaxID=412133 RepID=A2FEM1_TRIV3|nr:hypothetical protein TVAGG3_0849830 [Trichomonas vaginalis G3]EAX96650.1 hypothetical protein TVAG_023500 [Trichomonas vaginalis G3]KAI5499897.1 hypothetical protein TVAGG3_0849830 [Trichomonas vaginalis G3]|eukprot:XP_001309580.1 hypothetical protein [Trichomonas vaginalis G3]
MNPSLEEISKQLDTEIEKVIQYKKNLLLLADAKKKELEDIRKNNLRFGTISTDDLDDIIEILGDFENATPQQKQYVINTFKQLSSVTI